MILDCIGLVLGFLAAPKTCSGSQSHGTAQSIMVKARYSMSIMKNANADDLMQKKEHMLEETSRGKITRCSHDEHLLHQLQNKPWAALYVAAFFFFMIALGTLAFYAIQRAAQAGWSPVLYRVMEGITAYLLPGGIIVLLFLLSGLHLNHLFIWMDPEVVAHDKLIAGKVAFLNVPFFLRKSVFFLAGWSLYRYISRKFSLAQDEAQIYRITVKTSACLQDFLCFYCNRIYYVLGLDHVDRSTLVLVPYLDGMYLPVCLYLVLL